MDTLLIYAVATIFFAVSLIKDRKKTKAAVLKAIRALAGILPQMLAVVIIIALVLAIFDPEAISRFIGEESGFVGMVSAGLVGAITLIPGFIAFPAAGELLRNGAGTLQIATFVSSLMMVGLVTLPMEVKYLGKRVALTRNALALAFSFVAAYFVALVVAL